MRIQTLCTCVPQGQDLSPSKWVGLGCPSLRAAGSSADVAAILTSINPMNVIIFWLRFTTDQSTYKLIALKCIAYIFQVSALDNKYLKRFARLFTRKPCRER